MRKPQKLEMRLVREKTLKLFFSATNAPILSFCHAEFISASYNLFFATNAQF